ncbi:hypothetical protein [Pseudomonas syringae]|nr:hypothetical protein [Pseudomonas syringae]MBS7414074.1 hypothetical protein [Pseudomonas syringae]
MPGERGLERYPSEFQLAEGLSDQPIRVSGNFLALSAHVLIKPCAGFR